MKKILFTLIILTSAKVLAQPTIDGVITDAQYSIIGTNTSGQNGFGDDNDLGVIKYYADGTDIYIGITGELTNNDNVVVFLNFSGYVGRTGFLAGTGSSSTGVFRTSLTAGEYGLDGATMDMDVDFALAFNEGIGSTNLYLDAARYGTDGYINSGFVGSSDQSGTSATYSAIASIYGGTGSITFAYRNDFSINTNNGIEFKIPIAAFSGVTNVQTVRVFAIITSAAGYISNECIPGDPGAVNLGNDANLSTITSQDFFTSTQTLPVELVSFTSFPNHRSVDLRWSTATEINNAGFEIERKQNSEWRTIGFVEGHGTTNSPKTYTYSDKNLAAGTYLYRLKQIDRDGSFEYSGHIEAAVALTSGDYALSQNYPNPFNPVTTFNYAVKKRQHVEIKVFNLIGQEVSTLVDNIVEPNTLHSVRFDASALTSGIYFYSLRTSDRHEIRKLMLVK